MGLGSFGGEGPVLAHTSGGGGVSAVGAALDRSRELQGPSPEGQVALREQVKSDQVTGIRSVNAGSTVTTTSTTDTDLDSMTITYTPVSGNTGAMLHAKVNAFNDTIAATVTVSISLAGSVHVESEAVVTSPAAGQTFCATTIWNAPAQAVTSRTDKLVWRVSGGTGSAARRVFTINEQYR